MTNFSDIPKTDHQQSALTPGDHRVGAFTQAYMDYIVASPTSFHAASEAARLLTESGFQRLDARDSWSPAPGAFFLQNGGALIAWVTPETFDGFSIVGAHTDSPALKLKPTPQSRTNDGWGQLSVEVYGGPLYNSWLDRELQVAGIVMDRAGSTHLVQTGPIARIPQLAPHLDRQVNSDGLKLNAQKHLQPIWNVDDEDADILEAVAQRAGMQSKSDLAASELFLVPTEPPARFGVEQEFLAAGRQDNLSSSFAGLSALIGTFASHGNGGPSTRVSVLALFDHEEVGSASATGAHGPMLPTTLRRISLAAGKTDDEHARLLARTSLISADAGHSVHPNYPDKHDPDTRPVLGRGPILKVDADQRYSTSLEGTALWNSACESAGVTSQAFVSESSMRSGSTIGPALSTLLGVTTVDVGVGLLSMHSARELSHVLDNYALRNVLAAYWADSV